MLAVVGSMSVQPCFVGEDSEGVQAGPVSGCWWLLVLVSRTPRAGVGRPVTVSEPRFLLMFPPGVTPTLRGGEGRRVLRPGSHLARSLPSAFLSTFQEKRNQGHLSPF